MSQFKIVVNIINLIVEFSQIENVPMKKTSFKIEKNSLEKAKIKIVAELLNSTNKCNLLATQSSHFP